LSSAEDELDLDEEMDSNSEDSELTTPLKSESKKSPCKVPLSAAEHRQRPEKGDSVAEMT
jgi:hypothetical protein